MKSKGNWWVGLTDKWQEGTFVWESGHQLSIQQWNGREPNDAGSGEDCTQFNNGGLNDNSCTDSKATVVCQKGKLRL